MDTLLTAGPSVPLHTQTGTTPRRVQACRFGKCSLHFIPAHFKDEKTTATPGGPMMLHLGLSFPCTFNSPWIIVLQKANSPLKLVTMQG